MPEGEKEAVFNALLAHLDSIGNHFDTGIMATPLLLKVLSDNGCADIAFRLMNQREVPGFGYVMDDRYSCLWERWEGKASRCHPMFGSVVAWFYRTLAGIRYDEAEPGMKHIVIAPQPVGGLTYCSGSYQSLYGPVRSDWRIEADSFELTVEVPANTTATGYLAGRQDIRECWIGHPSVRVASYVGSLNQIEGKIPHPAVLIEVSFFYLLGFWL